MLKRGKRSDLVVSNLSGVRERVILLGSDGYIVQDWVQGLARLVTGLSLSGIPYCFSFRPCVLRGILVLHTDDYHP
jgi:hypothetical protein